MAGVTAVVLVALAVVMIRRRRVGPATKPPKSDIAFPSIDESDAAFPSVAAGATSSGTRNQKLVSVGSNSSTGGVFFGEKVHKKIYIPDTGTQETTVDDQVIGNDYDDTVLYEVVDGEADEMLSKSKKRQQQNATDDQDVYECVDSPTGDSSWSANDYATQKPSNTSVPSNYNGANTLLRQTKKASTKMAAAVTLQRPPKAAIIVAETQLQYTGLEESSRFSSLETDTNTNYEQPTKSKSPILVVPHTELQYTAWSHSSTVQNTAQSNTISATATLVYQNGENQQDTEQSLYETPVAAAQRPLSKMPAIDIDGEYVVPDSLKRQQVIIRHNKDDEHEGVCLAPNSREGIYVAPSTADDTYESPTDTSSKAVRVSDYEAAPDVPRRAHTHAHEELHDAAPQHDLTVADVEAFYIETTQFRTSHELQDVAPDEFDPEVGFSTAGTLDMLPATNDDDL